MFLKPFLNYFCTVAGSIKEYCCHEGVRFIQFTNMPLSNHKLANYIEDHTAIYSHSHYPNLQKSVKTAVTRSAIQLLLPKTQELKYGFRVCAPQEQITFKY